MAILLLLQRVVVIFRAKAQAHFYFQGARPSVEQATRVFKRALDKLQMGNVKISV